MRKHLRELSRQSLSREHFEVIVVNDGGSPVEIPPETKDYNFIYLEKENAGPAAARNFGAKHAIGDALLFVGDDSFPHQHLLFRHWLCHKENEKVAVQGYTDWWAGLPPLEFENFLYESGLQANWGSLKNPDGSWKREATGFCMTTNFSVNREEYERLY